MKLEDRVREALIEAAGALDDMPPLRLPQREAGRRRLPTAAMPTMAAAAVAVLIIVIMAISGTLSGTRHERPGLASAGANRRASAPLRPANPPRFIVATRTTGRPLVLDALSGRMLATIPLQSERGLVAALPDNRTFIVSGGQSGTVSFFRVRLDERGRPGRPTELPGTTDPGGVGAMAISPDGERLAYAPYAGLRAVSVMAVATGDTRSWTAGTDGNIRTLSWAPDGRKVAAVFRVEGGNLIELLDPAARGSDLDAGRQILKPEDGPIVDSAVYAADGASLIGADTSGDVVRLPIADRPPTTTVITKAKADRVLALAGSGRYLLIARGTTLLRLDLLTGKSKPIPLPGPKPNSSDDFNIAW